MLGSEVERLALPVSHWCVKRGMFWFIFAGLPVIMVVADRGSVVSPSSPSGRERQSTVRLRTSRVQTLGEWCRFLEKEGAGELHVDRRLRELKVYVSAGAYKTGALVSCIPAAWGAEVRPIGRGVTHWGFSRGERVREAPAVAAAVRQELLRFLPQALSSLRPGELGPFVVGDFLIERRVPFSTLKDNQQQWLHRALMMNARGAPKVKTESVTFLPAFKVWVCVPGGSEEVSWTYKGYLLGGAPQQKAGRSRLERICLGYGSW